MNVVSEGLVWNESKVSSRINPKSTLPSWIKTCLKINDPQSFGFVGNTGRSDLSGISKRRNKTIEHKLRYETDKEMFLF